MEKKKQVPIRQVFDNRAWGGNCRPWNLRGYFISSTSGKNKETVRMKEDGSEVTDKYKKEKRRRQRKKEIAYNTGYFLKVTHPSCKG